MFCNSLHFLTTFLLLNLKVQQSDNGTGRMPERERGKRDYTCCKQRGAILQWNIGCSALTGKMFWYSFFKKWSFLILLLTHLAAGCALSPSSVRSWNSNFIYSAGYLFSCCTKMQHSSTVFDCKMAAFAPYYHSHQDFRWNCKSHHYEPTTVNISCYKWVVMILKWLKTIS